MQRRYRAAADSQSTDRQYPTQQYPTQQYPTQQYPTQQYPTQQFTDQQYPTRQFADQQYPTRQYPELQVTNLWVGPAHGERLEPSTPPEPDGPGRSRHPVRDIVAITVSSALTCALVGQAVASVASDRNAPWILGRASGVASYLLLVALVAMGLVLSHPHRVRWHRPRAATRMRIHVSLAVFTLAFLVLHIVVLATDEYAKVGWWGALLPMASQYRPTAVTLGVLGTYCGLLAGLTAALAGGAARRVWWPVHKVAGVALVLSWLHGVLAGSDSSLLIVLYLGTAAGLLLLALTRYTAATPADRVHDLIGSRTRPGGARR